MQPDRSQKQAEALKDEMRFAIYDFVQQQDRPVTTGRVVEAVDGIRGWDIAFRHIALLVDAGLVEETGEHPATYQAVER